VAITVASADAWVAITVASADAWVAITVASADAWVAGAARRIGRMLPTVAALGRGVAGARRGRSGGRVVAPAFLSIGRALPSCGNDKTRHITYGLTRLLALRARANRPDWWNLLVAWNGRKTRAAPLLSYAGSIGTRGVTGFARLSMGRL